MTGRRRPCGLSLPHRRHIVASGHGAHGGHIMTCRRSRSGLSRAHRRHIVSGGHRTHGGHIMTGRRRPCGLSLPHRRHIVASGHGAHGGHIMTCRRSRSGLSRAHRRHVVTCGRSRSGLSLAHRRHIMACVGVDRDRRRLLRHGAGWTHRRARRPDTGRIRRRRTAAHTTGRKNGCSLRGRGRRSVARMTLREHRAGRGGQEQWDKANGSADHDEAPSIGRTVTTLNMPACMCISM